MPATTTYVMELRRLTDPGTPVPYFHDTPSIDHNLYIRDEHVYESNYTAGLRVLTYDRHSLRAGELHEVGCFDVVPEVDVPEFAGTWSNYRFFDSGIVVVSTIESGLIVLRPVATSPRRVILNGRAGVNHPVPANPVKNSIRDGGVGRAGC